MSKVLEIQNRAISSFILKLSQLLEDTHKRNIIHWNCEGDAFIIDSHNELIQSILAQYFNHTKISSFIRQLNLYGFRKISERGSQMIYQHCHFIKDNHHLHKMIRRKPKNKQKIQKVKEVYPQYENSIANRQRQKNKELEYAYFRIKKENQRLNQEKQLIKNYIFILGQIKVSNFFSKIRTVYGSSKESLYSNNIFKKDHHRKAPQIMKGECNTAETQTNRMAESLSNQNRTQYYLATQNMENKQNAVQDEQNNQVESLSQNISQISCDKMGFKDRKFEHFWGQNNKCFD